MRGDEIQSSPLPWLVQKASLFFRLHATMCKARLALKFYDRQRERRERVSSADFQCITESSYAPISYLFGSKNSLSLCASVEHLLRLKQQQRRQPYHFCGALPVGELLYDVYVSYVRSMPRRSKGEVEI